MPMHTVTKHGTTKSGKAVVYFDNKHNYTDMIFLGDTEAPPVGSLIDADTASSRRDGKTFWFLNGWGLAPNSQPAPQGTWKPQTTVPLNATAPMPEAPKPAPAGYSEPERMFVSNIVAAAVTAGHAKDPIDLIAWASGALVALRKMNDHANDAAVPF